MKNLILLIGPTAVGKTDLSIDIAKTFDTEIVSADSRQIYQEMAIGTAVPTKDQLAAVPHHFIQSHSIHGYYNASMFEMEALNVIDKLFLEKDCVVMTGGSTLYIDAVVFGIDELPTVDLSVRNRLNQKFLQEGISALRFELRKRDPAYYKKVDLMNHQRIIKALEISYQTGKPYSEFLSATKKERPFNIIFVGLERQRDELFGRINQRVNNMIDDGLLDEAKSLFEFRTLNALNTVGYKEVFEYMLGIVDIHDAVENIKTHTRRYAKKQINWFSKYKDISWFHPDDKGIVEYIKMNIK